MCAVAPYRRLLVLAAVLSLMAIFAASTALAQEAGDPAFVPEGELPIGAVAPTKDADELPVTERPDDVPDDWASAVPGEPLPDSLKDKRDASVRAPAPEDLEVTAYDDNSISLEWEETTSTAPVIAYLVEIKEGTGNWVTQQTVFNRTSATASGLDCDTSYSFRVRAAAFPMGYGGPSNTVTQSTTLCTVDAPGSFVASADGCNAIRLSWEAPAGVAMYRIDRFDPDYDDDGEWIVYAYPSRFATTYTRSIGITEGTAYLFRISAKGDGTTYSGEYGPSSAWRVFSTPFCDRVVSYARGKYEAEEEGSSVTIRVTFVPSLRMDRSIPITRSGSGSYTTTGLTRGGRLSASEGDSTASFTLAANEDANCADETVTLGFTLPFGMVAGTNSSTEVTLTDNDLCNDPPNFEAPDPRSLSVRENRPSGASVGFVTATDPDGDDIAYTLNGSSRFTINAGTGQITTTAVLDRETVASYSLTATATDEHGATDQVDVDVTVENVDEAPWFPSSETGRRRAPENAANRDVGSAVSARDVDGFPLTYSIGNSGDAAAFTIQSSTGQLRTRAGLNHEAKSTYTFTVTVRDATNLRDTQSVTVSVTDVEEAPEFPGTESGSRSVTENTPAGEDFGDPVAAEDDDGDDLTYTLGGTDAASFDIVATTGQLQTKAALNHEGKSSYSVIVTATDTTGRAVSKVVLITVLDVDECPERDGRSRRGSGQWDGYRRTAGDLDGAGQHRAGRHGLRRLVQEELSLSVQGCHGEHAQPGMDADRP